MSKAIYFLKKALGEDIFESLQKTELYKPDTRSVTSLEDIHLGLKLVPKTIMGMLVRELPYMKAGEHKDINLPVQGEAILHVEKLGPDVYSGTILQENKKIAEFAYRPVPGVALVIMSTFELYDTEEYQKPEPEEIPEVELATIGALQEEVLSQLIDKRLALHSLISSVVDKKIEEKDAIQKLVLQRISEAMAPTPISVIVPIPELPVEKIIEEVKKRPLESFLDSRKSKLKKNEFFIRMEKNDKVSCTDCGKEIFNDSGFSGCICYGENMNSKVSIKKSEHGVKLSFGRDWDPENLEALLELLRSKNLG